MIIRHITSIIVLVLLTGNEVWASQDKILPWSEVRIVSAGQDDTGLIAITARVDGDNWLALEIEAYGRKYKLDERKCALLKGFPLNGVQMAYGVYSLAPANTENAVYVQIMKLSRRNAGHYHHVDHRH